MPARSFRLSAALATALAVMSTAALAEPMACDDLAQATAAFADGPSHMVPMARATDGMGRPMVLFVGLDGAWMLAVVIQGAAGAPMACFRAMGKGWQAVVPAVPGRPS